MLDITFTEIDAILELHQPEKALTLQTFKGGCQEIFIYGAGNCGRDVARLLQAEGITLSGFLDGHQTTGLIADLPVWHPTSDHLTPDRRAVCCIIVAIFNPFVDVAALFNTLKSYGYQRIITFPEFFQIVPERFGDRFWLTSASFYDAHKPEIIAGGSLLHDEASRKLYLALLTFRMTGDYRILPPPSTGTQYFDHELPRWSEPVSFIDCGSFTGDTLRDLADNYETIAEVVAFEPDRENFGKLVSRVRDTSSLQECQSILYPCAVWSETTTLSFSADNSTSSAIISQGEVRVQCVALDDALPSFRPTLIKMDIEGAELHALKGARRMIEAHRPGLAISVYHAPDHLWEIALLIESWGLNYRFYLSCYCYAGFDVVLYATPA